MKRKLLILASIVIFFQAGLSNINFEVWNKSREELVNSNITAEEAYEKLINAGSIGYDFNDVYLNVILKEKNSEELLEKVFDNSKSNVGKIVSLQGMYRVNNIKYQKMKKKLRGKVNLFHGCYYVKEDAKRYLTGIEPYLESQTRMQD